MTGRDESGKDGEMWEWACAKSFPSHFGGGEREKRREWGGVCRAIWDEIRGERRKSGDRGGRGGMSN